MLRFFNRLLEINSCKSLKWNLEQLEKDIKDTHRGAETIYQNIGNIYRALLNTVAGR